MTQMRCSRGRASLDLLAMIRQDDRHRPAVVVLTALADVESAVAAFAAGADDFVSKPFNSAEAAGRVRAHYQMNQLRQRWRGTHHVGQLRNARLQSNRTTGTAVGTAMMRVQLDAQQAFKACRIRQQSNRKLHLPRIWFAPATCPGCRNCCHQLRTVSRQAGKRMIAVDDARRPL